MEHKNTRKYSKQAIRIARAFTMAALMSEHVAACLILVHSHSTYQTALRNSRTIFAFYKVSAYIHMFKKGMDRSKRISAGCCSRKRVIDAKLSPLRPSLSIPYCVKFYCQLDSSWVPGGRS